MERLWRLDPFRQPLDMDLDYWEKTLPNYDAEVVSVYDSDAEGVISTIIKELSESTGGVSSADMGCGVGKFTELLASVYGRVESCDFSPEGLRLTRERCRSLKHINYHCMDLTADPSPFNPVELVLCINVLMMPSLDERMRAWRTVSNQVCQKGHILLVVPAIESILMERHLELEGCLHEGHSCEESLKGTLPYESTTMDLHQGVYVIEHVPTKHYLGAELSAILEEHEFTVQQLQPLHYRRNVHEQNLDTWDWLIVAQRN